MEETEISTKKDEKQTNEKADSAEKSVESEPPPEAAESYSGKADISCDVLVLGSGPGGYTAAFRAADLGAESSFGGTLQAYRRSVFKCGLYTFQDPAPCRKSHRRNGVDE